jgi:Family of unknown function (DUF5681)
MDAVVARRPESTGGKQVTGRECRESTQFKPGQSGNPGGRPKGSRNKLSEEFFQDLYDVWQAFGKPALETMAMLYPAEFVRLVASLLPKEPEAITPQLWSACLTRSSMPLSPNFKAALILQRRMRTRGSLSRWARFYGVKPAPHLAC